MISFINQRLENTSWPNTIVQLIGRVREYKGKETLYAKQTPEILEELKKTAMIQSIESSNRIEGIVVAEKRMPLIVQGVRPQDRSEAEVAGYRDVLDLIHTSAAHMPLKANLLLQMHRDLMSYATGSGGRWKTSDNYIREKLPTGEERIRFTPVPAWRTPEAIDELISLYNQKLDQGLIDSLILIGTFVIDFLCIHPFSDGNGRMARLLTLMLLYQSGYEVGRYISLEKVIEETKDQYYDTLEKSSVGWHEGQHDLKPWLEYFLFMLLKAYQRFEDRVGTVEVRQKGWKEKQVENVVQHMIADFAVADVQERCPGISRPTIQRVLNRLGHDGIIECIERGRNARWKKV